MNNLKLITQIEEVPAAVPGEPDCKMIEPYVLGQQDTLSPWLVECTSQNEFMISSDTVSYTHLTLPTILRV